jgi:hypothetical protein
MALMNKIYRPLILAQGSTPYRKSGQNPTFEIFIRKCHTNFENFKKSWVFQEKSRSLSEPIRPIGPIFCQNMGIWSYIK